MNIHSKITNDGFGNVHKSLGSQKDITTNTFYTRNPYITQQSQMLNGLYANWLGGKAVDIPIEDAFRGGRNFSCEDQDKLVSYEEFIKKMNINTKLQTAMKWAKIFGSAVAIIVSKDDEMSEPLIVDNIKQGDVQDIIVLDRWQLYSMDVNRNPMSSNYLNPSYYYVTKTASAIHHSRVLRFDGLETTLYDKEMMNGWSLSIYERFYKSMQNAQISPDLLINLLVQSNVDVFHIEGLNDALMDGNDDLVAKRLQATQTGKSIYNGIALDSKDQYSNINKSFSGLDSVHNIFIDMLCASVDIPKTRYMNIQSSGLANDGTGDLKFYYDRIESNERAILRDAYDYLDAILTRSLFGEELEMSYEFESLFQMTPQQQAEMRNKDAQTNQIYLTNDILTPLEIKEILAKDSYYTSITPESVEEESELFEELEAKKNEFEEEI